MRAAHFRPKDNEETERFAADLPRVVEFMADRRWEDTTDEEILAQTSVSPATVRLERHYATTIGAPRTLAGGYVSPIRINLMPFSFGRRTVDACPLTGPRLRS